MKHFFNHITHWRGDNRGMLSSSRYSNDLLPNDDLWVVMNEPPAMSLALSTGWKRTNGKTFRFILFLSLFQWTGMSSVFAIATPTNQDVSIRKQLINYIK
jgi:hypothetical protein